MDKKDFIKINQIELSNGLRLVHHYMPDTAMVTLNVLYNVGAKMENPELTGLAHLFEHLMFAGTLNVPDFDKVLSSAGGMSNAWTGNDFTNFYEIVPSHNAETLFYLESDRMMSPAITERALDIQRSVVIEEFKQQCLNVPYGDIMHYMRSLVYGDHPYSWPVIGKNVDQLRAITKNDIDSWWRNNYYPANAVVSVVGNISFENTVRYATKWFERVDKRYPEKIISDKSVPELSERRFKEILGPVPSTMIMVAFLMSEYGTKQYFAADAVTDILSAGQASRFYQEIVLDPKSPIVEADASISGSEERGILMLTARLADESIDPDFATEYLIGKARSIITQGVSDYDLQRLKNKQHSMFVFSNMSSVTCAYTIAEAVMHHEKPGEKLAYYKELTSLEIQDTARNIFDCSQPAVIYYRPK